MCAAPPHDVLDAFNIVEAPRRLPGGQGTTYRAGEIILKPVANVVEAEWLAGLSNSIEEAGFRVARPMMSTHGTWIVNGWSASGFVVGEERHGRWNEKIAVSRAFHHALSAYPKPQHSARAQHPWAIADRFAWGDVAVTYHQRLAPALRELLALIQPVSLPNQLIHGDMTGNILFHDSLLPAVINMSPYWRPAAFATAIIVVDSIVWKGADDSIVNGTEDTVEMEQPFVRAAIHGSWS